ncbi:mitochondrial import inner membrane translocase subunit Tim54 [Delphinella strobiligena]|nr:mitochondrial import inner membrane translocase subunit Tim54 [Delphinella strobiligena]
MADSAQSANAAPKPAAPTAAPAAAAAAAAAEGNPVFRMMGLPNFKAKLPSRNWMIFLSITGTFAAAVIYDKHETKRTKQKWCDLVSPIASEKLPTNTLPRRISVYLESAPADGLRNAREHFHEYIKPVLVAAAMDWDVVEGRREGDVRYGTAERIRKFRRRKGEGEGDAKEEGQADAKSMVEDLREQMGTPREAGPAGDLVVGRHTWKEYVRGLHEGWLGPVNKVEEVDFGAQNISQDTPAPDSTHTPGKASLGDAAVTAAANIVTPLADLTGEETAHPITDDASPTAPSTPEEPKKEAEEEEKPKKNSKPDPFISTTAYASAQLPPSIPQELSPATIVPIAHILGFWNFPVRIWRFLNRRHLADDIGRRTAALVLASSRPFDGPAEQDAVLAHEESEWHKSIRKRDRSDGEESVWLDDMVIDERIGERMRLFELTAEDERVAERLLREPRSAKKGADDE